MTDTETRIAFAERLRQYSKFELLGYTYNEAANLIESQQRDIEAKVKEIEKWKSTTNSISKMHDDECKENQELKDEIAKLKVSLMEWQTIGSEKATQKEIVELSKDKERLDWLAHSNYQVQLNSVTNRYEIKPCSHYDADNIRQAIDAARKEQPK